MCCERFRGFCRICGFYPNRSASQPLPMVLNSLFQRKVKMLGQRAATWPPRSPPVAQSSPHGRGPVPSWPPLSRPGMGRTLPPTASHSHGAWSAPDVHRDTRGPPGKRGGETRKGVLPTLDSAPREHSGDKADSPKKENRENP